MENVSERDRNVFHILFESDPYDFDTEYETKRLATLRKPAGQIRPSDHPANCKEKVRQSEATLTKLNESYLELQRLHGLRSGDGRNRIPAIQPVINQQLTLLTASYGMRIHPFYQHPAIPSGRRLHGARRFARLRHGRRPREGDAPRDSTAGQHRRHRPRQRLRNLVQSPAGGSTSAAGRRSVAATSSAFRATRDFRSHPTCITRCGTTACASIRSTTSSWNSHPSSTSGSSASPSRACSPSTNFSNRE